jgi:hypothetical protein
MRRLKSRANIIETASPYLPMRGLGCSGPGFTIAWPFPFGGVVTLPYLSSALIAGEACVVS